MIRYCEYCKKEIDEKNVYGKGRFCNKRCQLLSIKDKGRQAAIEKAKARKQEKTVKKICPCCGKEFETVSGRKDELKFCSKHCSSTFSGNKSRERNEEVKKRISEGLKRHYRVIPKRTCLVCNKIIERSNKTGLCQHCLRTTERGKAIMAKNAKIAADNLVASGKHQGWKTRNISSYAEKFWIRVLDNNGISYKREFTAKYGEKPNEHYFLDFLIQKNNVNIDLEIDGKQHQYEDRKKHDEIRDKRLFDCGYIVYRIKWNEVNSEKGKLEMKEKINNFLNYLNSI